MNISFLEIDCVKTIDRAAIDKLKREAEDLESEADDLRSDASDLDSQASELWRKIKQLESGGDAPLLPRIASMMRRDLPLIWPEIETLEGIDGDEPADFRALLGVALAHGVALPAGLFPKLAGDARDPSAALRITERGAA